MVLAVNELLHLGPDPAGASWNHFDLGLGLATHINYPQAQLKNSPPQGAPWFYSRTNPTSGKDVGVFSAPLGGATTSTNTQYSRCELREYERDGTTKMAFNPKSGDHWIEGIYRIYGLSGLTKPGVCVQQYHDPNDDVIMVRTELESGATKLIVNFNGSRVAVLNSNYADGTEFYLKTRINAGTPSIYYTTNLASIPSTPTYTSAGFFSGAGTGWYAKTGSYNQTNENTDPNVDPDASIIRVEIRELKHWHSETPAGGAWPTPASYVGGGGATTPVVDAGADAQILPSGTFSRTASVTLNGATLSSQKWEILSGPSGAGNVLSTAAAVSWVPSATTVGSGVPVGQTQVFKETFDSGLSNTNYSSVQTHTYEGSPSGYNMNSEYRMQIVNDPSSATVLRTEVHDGDTAVGSHERCEVSSFGKFWNDHDGDERWYEFGVKFEAFPSMGSADDWLIFFQWHQVNDDGAPALAMSLHNDGKVYFERANDTDDEDIPVWTPALNTWYNVVVHIKWSTSSSTGFIQCHVDGVEKVAKISRKTMYSTDHTDPYYVKFGQYRRSSISGTSTVKHDNIRVSSPPAVTSGGTGGAYPNGTYILRYSAVTSAGTFTDNVSVTLTPTPTDPGTGGGGGGGGSLGTYPTLVGVGPTATSNGSTTVTVQPPTGVGSGQFQICIIQLDDVESIPNPSAGWTLLDDQDVPNTASPSNAIVLYNTTGDSNPLTLTKSGSGAYHAVRIAWKNYSTLGQHSSRGSSDTLTPYAPSVTPATDKALVVTIMGSDRATTGAGPVTVPTGWTSRYNSGQTVNSTQIEWIAVAEINVDNQTVTGANVPTGTGTGTSNFTLTNSDNCSMFSFVLEGGISTGVSFGGAVTLPALSRLTASSPLTPVPIGGILLTAFPQLIARSIVPGGIVIYVIPRLTLNASVFPKGALIILPNLTFQARQQTIAGLLLQAVAMLRAGALPYRRPVLRTEYVYPPQDHPFRLIAQRILDGEIIEWELPVSEDFEYTDQLSGPTVMHGSISPELIQVQELGLDGYAYWLHVEINQEIRASAIMLPPQYEESSMAFSAEGVAAVPHYTYYDSTFSQIQVDPLSVVRTLWNYVQAQPQSDYGVVVSQNSSPVRIGEPATSQAYNDRTEAASLILRRLQSGDPIFEDWSWDGAEAVVQTYNDELSRLYTDSHSTNPQDWLEGFINGHRAEDAKPYELNWWDAKNVGEEIDSLSGSTPFDYVERHAWNSDRTDVLHFIDLGYPRLGVARPNLLFNEENILEVVPVQEPEDTYASAVLVIGAGDGADTIRAYRAESFADRVRKEVVITDKSITNQSLADARAAQELAFRRGRAFEIGELVINAYHSNAPVGSYRIGDDIQVQVEIPWLMVLHTSWYRITSISNKPSSDKVRLGLARSDSLLDTSDIWIQPDDYVPFDPVPPIGAVAWVGNVHFTITPVLVVIPSVPVPTARVFLIATPNLTVNGVAFGGSFAFVNNLFIYHSLLIGNSKLIAFAGIALPVSPTLAVSGIVTGPGFSTVTLISNTLLTSASQIPSASVSLSATSSLTANATGTFTIGGGFGDAPFGALAFGPGAGSGGGGFGDSPFGSLPFGASAIAGSGGGVSLAAKATLTANARTIRSAAVAMSTTMTLSASGTVSSGSTTSQLGKITNGTQTSSSSANKTVVSKFTATATGTVTTGHARLWVDSGTASVEMVVYADASGSPGSLLGLSDTLTVSNTTEVLQNFTFSGTQQTGISAGNDYWIGFTWPDPGLNNISWSRDATAGSTQQNAFHAAASFGTPGTALSGPIDAYIDVVSTTGGGGGGPTTPIIRSSSSAAEGNSPTVACPRPPGLTSGDYIVVFQESDTDGSLSSMTAPSGFSLLGSQAPATAGNGTPYGKVWGKIATSSDVSTSTFSFPDDTGANCTVVMLAIQGGTFDSSSPVSNVTWIRDNSGSTSIQAPSITGTSGDALITAHMAETGGTVRTFSSGPSGMTQVIQSTAGNSTYTRIGVYEQDLASSGATGTKTATLSGAPSGWLGVALQVNAA